MKKRTTPELVDLLKENQIFVFGSNLSGLHLGGAARKAMEFGAIYEQAIGRQGDCYAIPTLNAMISRPLKISDIQKHVNDFLEYAKKHPDLTFLVTEIGCGIAGFNPSEIAPLFTMALGIENVFLPAVFWKEIYEQNSKLIGSKKEFYEQ